jgi:hypothetical protein
VAHGFVSVAHGFVSVAHGFSRAIDRRLDRFKDLLIAGAASQITRECFFDLIASRRRMFVQQHLRSHQEPWRAVATLGGAEIGECVLQRMQPAVTDQPFDGCDTAAIAIHAEHQAGQNRLAVEQDSARTAFTQLAAVLGAAQVQVFTQDLEQRFVRGECDFDRFAVDGERD